MINYLMSKETVLALQAELVGPGISSQVITA